MKRILFYFLVLIILILLVNPIFVNVFYISYQTEFDKTFNRIKNNQIGVKVAINYLWREK
jgi:hypothetical protein